MSEDKKVFRVVVVYEFEGIDDPNSPEADEIVDEVTEVTSQTLFGEWESSFTTAGVWVEDAYTADGAMRKPKKGYTGDNA
jgi:hypothetical protein